LSSADARQTRSLLERVFREEAGRLTASLVRLLGDFDLAEDMVADAVAEALARWDADGMPERPGAWLLTTARRKAIDRLRRDARYRDKLALLRTLPESVEREPDDRLRLLFTCCHPALGPDAQVALTLRAVAGLTTAEIARAFLVSESAMTRRLTRAKRKIVDAAIPYRVPQGGERHERLTAVLRVVYLVFNEGFLATAGPSPARRELADDAEWLAELLVGSMPDEPEPLGLLALIRFNLARWATRIDAHGQLVLLEHQDRTRWNRGLIANAEALLARAAAFGRLGPYQIEAAITAVHCDARTWTDTDWPQLLELYSLLATVDPSPIVKLNRAVVLANVHGPQRALAEIDTLAEQLASYHLLHATRATLLRRLGRHDEARTADTLALEHATNDAERALIAQRIT
jgi:RNA polymerase sigma factor (sigma-70 family)